MSRRVSFRIASRFSVAVRLSLAFASTLFVVADPLEVQGQILRPKVPIPRELITLPEYMRPGQHTLSLDVAQSLSRAIDKRYKDVPVIGLLIGRGVTCVPIGKFPGHLSGTVGWGQSEWGDSPCMAAVLQLAVNFDTTKLDKIPVKVIDRAILTYDEAAAPICPLVYGGPNACWQSGQGIPEDKPDGCAVVRVPSVNWAETVPPSGLIPYAGASPAVNRISAREWDVTEPVRWQKGSAAPLGASPTYGFLLSGGLSLDQLTAEDNTVCISALANIKLHVTYTVPPEGEPFRAPR
ncbi:hypothetical protein [Leptolyngbya sp. GGD]|uniref:hypothetical protein n=1 Tax=Leptolyngbya sp. GGD TaxID=2997907 RepID=UPI00227B780F|nr:hypothetical protein [Leptolyngbya sp. GGD]MCY6489794.1 hypothetical protein [Leptolyngbya sp. GGD]